MGGKNLGEGIVEALRGCGKLKMYVVLSLFFFFFLSRDLSFYRGRLSREDKGNEDGWEVFVRLCVV